MPALKCRQYILIISTSKATGTDLPERKLQMHGMVNPWDDQNKHETLSKVAEFKYRHKTRDGHYEDSLPTLNQDTIKVSSPYPSWAQEAKVRERMKHETSLTGLLLFFTYTSGRVRVEGSARPKRGSPFQAKQQADVTVACRLQPQVPHLILPILSGTFKNLSRRQEMQKWDSL